MRFIVLHEKSEKPPPQLDSLISILSRYEIFVLYSLIVVDCGKFRIVQKWEKQERHAEIHRIT